MTTSPDRRGGASRDVVSSRFHGVRDGAPEEIFASTAHFFKTKRVPRRRSVPHSKALVVEACTKLGTEVVKQCSGAKDGPWRAGTGRAGVRARAGACEAGGRGRTLAWAGLDGPIAIGRAQAQHAAGGVARRMTVRTIEKARAKRM